MPSIRSTKKLASTVLPGVTYEIRATPNLGAKLKLDERTLEQRIAYRTKQLEMESLGLPEPSADGSPVAISPEIEERLTRLDLELGMIARELLRLRLDWGLVSTEGLDIDGNGAPTLDQLLAYAPDALLMEIDTAIRAEIEVEPDAAKKSELLTISSPADSTARNDSTAENAPATAGGDSGTAASTETIGAMI